MSGALFKQGNCNVGFLIKLVELGPHGSMAAEVRTGPTHWERGGRHGAVPAVWLRA